jgi:Tfp pilus assembly protein PilF
MRSFVRVVAMGMAMTAAGVGLAQNLPPGTHSVDDPTQQNPAQAEIAAAESALEHGDYAGAETKLKALATSHPKDARVQYDLGFAADHNNDEAVAEAGYRAAIAADDSIAEPKLALGLMEARADKNKQAHDDLLMAANMQSAAPELRARAFRAMANLDDGEDPINAQNELMEALKLTPEAPADVRLGAELAEQMGEPELAEKAYRRTLEQSPGDVEATAGLAHVLMQQKKLDEADKVVTEGLAAHSGDPRLVAQAVPIYIAESNSGAAENKSAAAIPMMEALRKSDAAFAANAEMTRVLAHLYETQNDEASAEKLYLELATKTPDDPTLLDDLGSAEVRLGKYAQAETVLSKAFGMRKAFDDDDAWGETAEHLAFAASKNNDPKMALQALAARATVMPNSASSLFLEAISHDSLHQRKEAEESYKAFLAAANGKFPDQEFQAKHRLVALRSEK